MEASNIIPDQVDQLTPYEFWQYQSKGNVIFEAPGIDPNDEYVPTEKIEPVPGDHTGISRTYQPNSLSIFL
jgi:hypothetical protein